MWDKLLALFKDTYGSPGDETSTGQAPMSHSSMVSPTVEGGEGFQHESHTHYPDHHTHLGGKQIGFDYKRPRAAAPRRFLKLSKFLRGKYTDEETK